MPREKQGYGETLEFLDAKFHKGTLMKKEVAEYLGISGDSLRKLLKHGELHEDCCGRISIGSLAKYLCG